ncbi:hypothetical protein BLA24_33195 [Streptomyces cinnamoneus]|uniref:Uncharacterized protein n=1 Tax=Streptomyces cinnamoneus TaxID=53446 RepID=A0A2G1XAM7_STRCJ|nr:hypothetical protein BLA24_33195 [Streptomyces cinnamoneus]PPT15895.1 hypothetical protein CYQ11_26245 [Streptomyces cinnamoneus]
MWPALGCLAVAGAADTVSVSPAVPWSDRRPGRFFSLVFGGLFAILAVATVSAANAPFASTAHRLLPRSRARRIPLRHLSYLPSFACAYSVGVVG